MGIRIVGLNDTLGLSKEQLRELLSEVEFVDNDQIELKEKIAQFNELKTQHEAKSFVVMKNFKQEFLEKNKPAFVKKGRR